MTTFAYQITSTPFKINSTGYTIRQFSIRNPTPYPVYININSFTPTKDRYDYLIQPNTSVFVSNAIETREITIVPATLVTRDTVIEITVSDDASLQAAGVPQFSPQFTGSLAGYPVLIPVGTSSINLPIFTLDKFLPVFFLVDASGSLDNTPFIISDFTTPFGSYPQQGGVVSYLPKSLPITIQAQLDMVIPTITAVTVNAIQSPQPFDDVYVPQRSLIQISALTSQTFYFAVKPPASIFSFSILPVSGTAYDIDINLSIFGSENIITSHFVGNTAVPIYVIRPKVILENSFKFYTCVVTNNHATQDTYVIPTLSPL